MTEPFGDQVNRSMAYQPSDKPLPAIVVSHPTQMVEDDVLRDRAREIADAVERLLKDESP